MEVCSQKMHVREKKGAGGRSPSEKGRGALRAGREERKTPAVSPEGSRLHPAGRADSERKFRSGGSLTPGALRHRGCPTGQGQGRLRTPCGALPAPGLPLRSLIGPSRRGKRLHFPALPSSKRALQGASPALAFFFPRRGLGVAAAGRSSQPRPRSSRGPAAPLPPPPRLPCRRGAVSARQPGRHTAGASGAAGSAMRAAACLLSLALCALPAAPGESWPRGSAAALRAGAAVAGGMLCRGPLRSPVETEPPLQPARRGRGRSRVTGDSPLPRRRRTGGGDSRAAGRETLRGAGEHQAPAAALRRGRRRGAAAGAEHAGAERRGADAGRHRAGGATAAPAGAGVRDPLPKRSRGGGAASHPHPSPKRVFTALF